MATKVRAVSPRTTIAEIAKRAGVSEPTVSKVLNEKSDVAPATRERVKDLLEESGYTRRRPKADVATVGLVDFVITELMTPWASQLLSGAEEEAHKMGRSIVVTVTHDRNADARDWIQGLAARKSDGVILILTRLDPIASKQLAALNIRTVLIDPVGGSDPVIPTVGATNWAGALAATEHLTDLGHRRIGMISGPADVVSSQQRIDGYRAALGRVGIPLDEELVRYADFRSDGGRRAAAELLDLPDAPTAIFTGSDQGAAGVYRVAHSRGIRIPDDLSVVGFDDVEICKWLTPELTTVRQPLLEMARIATRAVLEPSDLFTANGPQHIELSTTLIERASTARLSP